MTTKHSFIDADRYLFDFKLCTPANGWAQIDTMQDAPYYGTWCNPERREIVNYCEGDVTHTKVETDEEFVAELRKLAEWNDRHKWGPMKIDPGFDTALAAAFKALGVGDLLH